MKLGDYVIDEIRTNKNHPEVIYASIHDREGLLCVSATLDYCVEWIKNESENAVNRK